MFMVPVVGKSFFCWKTASIYPRGAWRTQLLFESPGQEYALTGCVYIYIVYMYICNILCGGYEDLLFLPVTRGSQNV